MLLISPSGRYRGMVNGGNKEDANEKKRKDRKKKREKAQSNWPIGAVRLFN